MDKSNIALLPLVQPAVVTRLACVMRSAGWEINFIDIDLTNQTPKADIRVMRDDGRWLHARVDGLGRVFIDRFQRDRRLGMSASTKGRRPLSPLVDERFLGRIQCQGARQMLRELTNYLVDNATHPVTLVNMRSAWAALMRAPARIGQDPCFTQ